MCISSNNLPLPRRAKAPTALPARLIHTGAAAFSWRPMKDGIPTGYGFVDITGRRFGRLVVVRSAGVIARHRKWECLCDCGRTLTVVRMNLLTGHTQSCGCLRVESAVKMKYSHGKRWSKEYVVWQNMRRRCRDPKMYAYPWYGGRGIGVCKAWQDFGEFFRDMGKRPEGMTIGRKDNDGDYEPSNCEWQTWEQQRAEKTVRLREHRAKLKVRKS